MLSVSPYAPDLDDATAIVSTEIFSASELPLADISITTPVENTAVVMNAESTTTTTTNIPGIKIGDKIRSGPRRDGLTAGLTVSSEGTAKLYIYGSVLSDFVPYCPVSIDVSENQTKLAFFCNRTSYELVLKTDGSCVLRSHVAGGTVLGQPPVVKTTVFFLKK